MVTIKQGDCIDVMSTMPAQSVNCCVTSPPYYGLRDYGVNGQIGLEKSPDEFVAKMVQVFRGVHRVLRDDGTLWVNLGDSYSSQAGQRKETDRAGIKQQSNTPSSRAPSRCVPELGAKQLIGIPWRVAFALQADGWILRSDIIWHKPNPMPESVTDRCTKSHEYIFLLSKSPKYYFDQDAIKEPAICGANGSLFHSGKTGEHQLGRSSTKPRPSKKRGEFNGKTNALPGQEAFRAVVDYRNKRSVWTVQTYSYAEAHFATFPPNLIRPCILAGCPKGGTVLDVFGGSGTTGEVSEQEGRNSILIELNPDYVTLARRRTQQLGLLHTA